jgi:hypothetical protein
MPFNVGSKDESGQTGERRDSKRVFEKFTLVLKER